MISGETPGGIDDLNFSEITGLTLSIGDGTEVSLSTDNTEVFRSNLLPEADCIEITVLADDSSEARVIRIFDRLDLMKQLADLDYTVISGQKAVTSERLRAYTDWEASQLEDQDWAVLSKNGVPIGQFIDDIRPIAHPSPVTELHLDDGKIFAANYCNAQVLNYPENSMIASCIGLSTMDLDSGVVTTTYVFGKLSTEQELDELGYPVARLPYPSDGVVAAYLAHCIDNVDVDVLHMIGDDEATSA
jgi:hypothetical protein